MATAILGWGSLIWDDHPSFSEWHDHWLIEGPHVKLEFSRISRSRQNALTLVIDEEHGELCQVNYTLSKRRHFVDVVADLRCREGCNWQDIGQMENTFSLVDPLPNHSEESIRAWAIELGIQSVVWTALKSNFQVRLHKPFSLANATDHLRSLGAIGKAKAAEYIWRAPGFVNTPLRRSVQVAPWF